VDAQLHFLGDIMAKLGFVGLGVMGSRVVRRLLEAGYSVVGYNRTQSKAQWLLDAGMEWAASPRKVAEATDIVFSMVTNTAALNAVALGDDGILAGLSRGKIFVEMSTVSPAASRDLAKQVKAKGAAMLDAPVSGSVITLEQGQVSFMVGGDAATFEKVKPFLLDIGPKVTHVGGNGLAVTMKIAVNLSLAVQMLALSEGILIAEKAGIDRKTALEVMLNSVIASPMVKYRGPFVLKLPEEAWFDVNMMQKDLSLALELGEQLGIPLPTTKTTNDMLSTTREMGLEKEDFAVMFQALSKMAGTKK
jgi:3-hydroxyisobutyrate dehydrogenase-like beta-hydroxyacid dehydrogenase